MSLYFAVQGHIEAMWRADVTEKSSLKYENPNSLKVGKAHHVWSTVRNCLTDSNRAQLKCNNNNDDNNNNRLYL